MTLQRTFTKPALLKFGEDYVTDHNRQGLSISWERNQKIQVMANGSTRIQYIADKRTFSISWQDVPDFSSHTVDGFMGAVDIQRYFQSILGEMTLTISYGDLTTEQVEVYWTDCGVELSKRGLYDMYDVNVTLVEV